jgi:hypothetical protein
LNYIGLPAVDKKTQKTPTLEATEIETILAAAKKLYRVLYCLLAGSGLRIAEALGLEIPTTTRAPTANRFFCGLFGGVIEIDIRGCGAGRQRREVTASYSENYPRFAFNKQMNIEHRCSTDLP